MSTPAFQPQPQSPEHWKIDSECRRTRQPIAAYVVIFPWQKAPYTWDGGREVTCGKWWASLETCYPRSNYTVQDNRVITSWITPFNRNVRVQFPDNGQESRPLMLHAHWTLHMGNWMEKSGCSTMHAMHWIWVDIVWMNAVHVFWISSQFKFEHRNLRRCPAHYANTTYWLLTETVALHFLVELPCLLGLFVYSNVHGLGSLTPDRHQGMYVYWCLCAVSPINAN